MSEARQGKSLKNIGLQRLNALSQVHAWSFLPAFRDEHASCKRMELYMALPYVLLGFKCSFDDRLCAREWDLQGGDREGPAPRLSELVKPFGFKQM